MKLLDNYNPAVTIADEPVAVEVQEQREFLDELFKTDIIRDTVVSPLESAACIYLQISGGSCIRMGYVIKSTKMGLWK